MMMRIRSFTPSTVVMALLVATAGTAGLWWQFTLRGIEQEIAHYRASLKNLHLSGHVPPNHEVMAYLTRRTQTLQAQHQHALALVAPAPSRLAAGSDPQLAFQERMHEVQRTLERLTTARGIAMPLELGLPKELPPTEAVPRFLMQLGLIEGVAELAMTVEGVSQLVSFKAEDPRPVPEQAPPNGGARRGAASGAEGEVTAFVTELPVQVHLSCSLGALMQLLHLIDRAQPVMALQRVQVVSSIPPPVASAEGGSAPKGAGPSGRAIGGGTSASGSLDVELVVARYSVD